MQKLKVGMMVEEDTSIIDQMKEAYSNCPTAIKYCREIGIPDEKIEKNISKIFDFVCDINYCKKCPGISSCKKNNPLLVSKVLYKDGVVTSQLVPCKELLRQTSFEAQFRFRDFKDSWTNKKLKDLDETDERKPALKKYVEYVKGKNSGWIYLTGGIGSGKSFIAAIITCDAARRGLGPISFLNCTSRFRDVMNESFGKNNEFQKMIDYYSKVPIMVLDDFGNEYKTDFVRDAILYPILQNRLNKNMLTIITSDFTIEEIKDLYSINKQGEIRAKQIAKLLKSECGEEINLGDLKIY